MKNKINYQINRDAVKFILSQGISVLGSSVVNFSIIWYLVLKTSSSYILTITILCTYIPQALIALGLSHIGDRYNKKVLIIIGDIITAFVTLLLYIMISKGYDSLKYIYITCVLRSFGAGIQLPMVNSFLPNICDNSELKKVNSLNSTVNSLIQLVSPGIGGVILATFGFKGSLLIDVLTAIISILILSKIKYKILQENNTGDKIFNPRDIYDVWRHIKKSTILNRLIVFCVLFNFFVSIPAFFTPILVSQVYVGSIMKLTLNETMWSAGTLVGGLLLFFAKNNTIKKYAVTIKEAVIVFGLSIFLLGVVSNFILYLIILFVSGVAMTLYSTLNNIIIQSITSERYIGRVFSVIQTIISVATPFGIIILGMLSEYMGIRFVMSLSGIFIIIGVLFSKIGKNQENIYY